MSIEIVSYGKLFGKAMDDVTKKIGGRGNCTFCGLFRRRALEEGARKLKVDCVVTGHNADNTAETVILKFFREDISRLKKCTLSETKEHINDTDTEECLTLSRCKPFNFTHRKEIVFNAYFKKSP